MRKMGIMKVCERERRKTRKGTKREDESERRKKRKKWDVRGVQNRGKRWECGQVVTVGRWTERKRVVRGRERQLNAWMQ
jgi:hypothetical protein